MWQHSHEALQSTEATKTTTDSWAAITFTNGLWWKINKSWLHFKWESKHHSFLLPVIDLIATDLKLWRNSPEDQWIIHLTIMSRIKQASNSECIFSFSFVLASPELPAGMSYFKGLLATFTANYQRRMSLLTHNTVRFNSRLWEKGKSLSNGTSWFIS